MKNSSQFTPKKNISYGTFKLWQTSQKDGENIDAFHTRLQGMAIICDFHDVDKEILAQIIQGSTSSTVHRQESAERCLDPQKILKEARSLELSDSRAAAIEKAAAANAISSNANTYNVSYQNRVRRGQRVITTSVPVTPVVVSITTDTIHVLHN